MKKLSASGIAELVKGEIIGDHLRAVNKVSGLKDAGGDSVSFAGSKKYEDALNATQAGIVLICRDLAQCELNGRTFIICENCDTAFSSVAEFFAPAPIEFAVGIHPSAIIHPEAKIGKDVSIGACTVVEQYAEIGDRTVIGANCTIGHYAKIGTDCKLWPNVTVNFRCIIGSKVILHSGVVIGCDGFGYIPGPHGLMKVAQTGIVQIDDDVEIGANSIVDRARFGKTWIKRNVKIDSLVMVAHNVTIGESSILVAQCGIAGSAELGRGVILGAKAGVNGHITLGDGVQVAGTSNGAKGCPPGAIMLGTPAEPQRDFMTRHTLPKKVERMKAQISNLESKITELQTKLEELCGK